MSKRRKVYVEFNRHVELYVYLLGSDVEADPEDNFFSDFFVLSIPEPNSPENVWLVKNLNKKDSVWQRVSDNSLEAVGLESDMDELEIMELFDEYQRTQYDEGEDDFDYDDEDFIGEREYFDVEGTDYVEEEDLIVDEEELYDDED